MVPVRQLGIILALLCLIASGCGAAGTSKAGPADQQAAARQAVEPCTAFGKNWAAKYNAAGGPIRIVSVCCGIRSARTHNSACKVMVTVRQGPGHGTFGCSVATVAANGNILANRPQACVRSGGRIALPE